MNPWRFLVECSCVNSTKVDEGIADLTPVMRLIFRLARASSSVRNNFRIVGKQETENCADNFRMARYSGATVKPLFQLVELLVGHLNCEGQVCA